MKAFKDLTKEKQRANLLLRIPLERPDLEGMPFEKQINKLSYECAFVYFAGNLDAEIPQLHQDAAEYEAEKPLAYYKAMGIYYLDKSVEEGIENLELNTDNYELTYKNIKANNEAAEAKETLNRATDLGSRNN